MYNVGNALDGLFYMFLVAICMAAMLAVVIYILVQVFFGFTPWDVCVKMETDTAKVQCMEAHYE